MLGAIVALLLLAPQPAATQERIALPSVPGTLAFGGLDRTYRLYRPPTLRRAGAVPLVVVLHGGFGTGAQAERAYGWDRVADSGK